MKEQDAAKIGACTQQLEELLERCTMLSIAQSAAFELWKLVREGIGGTDMSSPYRQVCHILGVALTSDEHPEAAAITKEQWQEAKKLSTSVFEMYGLTYFSRPAEMQSLSAEEQRRIAVTMSMFLQELNSQALRSEDQLLARIQAMYVPFDDMLRERLGFSASDVVQLISYIKNNLRGQLNRAALAVENAKELHKQFVATWTEKGWDLGQVRVEAQKHPVADAARKAFQAMNALWFLDREDIKREIGSSEVEAMFSVLAISRGAVGVMYKYPTEVSPVVQFPLIVVGMDSLLCPAEWLLYHAAEFHFGRLLSQCNEAGRFFETRDKWMEKRTYDALVGLLGEDGHLWRGIYETADGQFEHDVIARVGGIWLVAEVKAAPVRRGFFDPDKAFVRIRDDFRGERGIQKAFEQGERLRRILVTSGRIRLFDANGRVVIDEPGPAQEAFVICVTGETWGSVAIDLSFLLEKDDDVPYPWAVSIDDLETFTAGLKTKGMGHEDMFRFLRDRSTLHGRPHFSGDELDICGCFIEHGSLPAIPDGTGTFLTFSPAHSTVFDDMYYEGQGLSLKRDRGREHEKYLQEWETMQARVASYLGLQCEVGWQRPTAVDPMQHKIGRNEPCPCGSGLKYKRCCGAVNRNHP